jgi:hypothetical protein
MARRCCWRWAWSRRTGGGWAGRSAELGDCAGECAGEAGRGALSFADLKVRVDPAAEWEQMYHEVWRIERAYFYDPHFHGTDTVADEKL